MAQKHHYGFRTQLLIRCAAPVTLASPYVLASFQDSVLLGWRVRDHLVGFEIAWSIKILS